MNMNSVKIAKMKAAGVFLFVGCMITALPSYYVVNSGRSSTIDCSEGRRTVVFHLLVASAVKAYLCRR